MAERMAGAGAPTSRPAPVAPILIAMVAGALVGWLVGPDLRLGSFDPVRLFEFLGTLFVNLLKMLIVPLISSSIVTSVAALGSGRDLGRLGLKTLAFYILTTLVAVLIALTVINIVQPGIVGGEPARHLLALEANAGEVTNAVKDRASASVFDTLLNIVPANVIQAAADTKLLGLVFFSVLFGYFLTRIPQPYRDTMTNFWQGLFHVMMRITEFVMRLAPIGVFALTARVVAKAGISAAGPILVFGACVVASLAIYILVALPFFIRTVGRVSPWRLFPAMTPALLTAFVSASSAATLPLSIECVEKRAKVSERIAGFVMPFGTSVNHAGSALYECAAAMFICQAYGLHLSFGTQFTVVVLALITSIGVAGIPAASLVGIAVILAAVGLPTEAIGVLLVLDRVLDMARTAVNVFSDAACAVIVARLEGETQVLKSA
jgi:Na+/H+-dicarboxylate symporter